MTWLRSKAATLAVSLARATRRGPNRLGSYSDKAPSPQNAVDIFAREWSSRFPAPFDGLMAGDTPLFQDTRVTWAIEQLGGVQGKHVLELGPLEGGHTYMLDRAGAASVLAIEGSKDAFLKCLITKEVVGIPSAQFAYGDFTHYLDNVPRRFDIVFASGVLYHLLDPLRFIAKVASISDAIFLWTMYYDEGLLSASQAHAHRVVRPVSADYQGFHYRLYRYDYMAALWHRKFCGGSYRYVYWMNRDDILRALEHFGFSSVVIGFDEPHHANGPAFGIVARK